MYNYEHIKKNLIELQNELNDWLKKLEENKEDIQKFYRRGNKKAGIRTRAFLKALSSRALEMRRDIKRLYKEREIFKKD